MDTAADERRHKPTGEPEWSEVVDLQFWSPDSSFGGFVRFELRPHDGVCWLWTALLGLGPLTTVLEFDSPLPRWPGLELRGPSLWCELIVETPLEHVSLGLEAFGVSLEDPSEVFAGGRGDLVPLGYDLEWESAAAPLPVTDGYEIPCVAHGEILLADRAIDFEGLGRRAHRWGARDQPLVPLAAAVPLMAPVERPDGTRRAWVLDSAGPYWAEIGRP